MPLHTFTTKTKRPSHLQGHSFIHRSLTNQSLADPLLCESVSIVLSLPLLPAVRRGGLRLCAAAVLLQQVAHRLLVVRLVQGGPVARCIDGWMDGWMD
jgi:hypothetical protein